MFFQAQEPGTGLCLGVNLKLWESLSKTDQTIIQTAATASNDLVLTEYNAANGDALADLRWYQGFQLHIVP